MKSIGVREIRAALPYYLNKVSADAEVYNITRHGRTVALLSPVSFQEKTFTRSENKGNNSGYQLENRYASARNNLLDKVRCFMAELETLGISELRVLFSKFYGSQPPAALSEVDLRKAVGRAKQHELWIESTGSVPVDILRRDRQFWARLLCNMIS